MTDAPGSGRFCEACGKQASGDARFCGGCGRSLGGAVAAARSQAPSPAPTGRGAPAPPPDDDDRPAEAAEEREVLTFRPLTVATFGQLALCLLTLGIAWIVLRLRRLQSGYRLTTQRLEIRTGFLSVTRRTIDLFRIEDMEVREPLFLRLRGAGELLLRTNDPGEPELLVGAVPDVGAVHESLRKLVADERRRTRVRVVEES